MSRLVYVILLGLIGAGIVHIAVLLLIPVYSDRDAWSQIALFNAPSSFVRLGDVAATRGALRTSDPLFEAAVCQFDLTPGPVHATAAGNKLPFWSMSVFDRRGQNVFSLNDRTATAGLFDVVIATPAQLIELRKDMPAEFEGSVFVETDIDEGMLVVRGLVPDPTWRSTVEAWLDGASCGTA